MVSKSPRDVWGEAHFSCPFSQQVLTKAISHPFAVQNSLYTKGWKWDLVVHFTAWFLGLDPIYCSNLLITNHLFHVMYNNEKFVCPLWRTFWLFLIIYSYLSKPKSIQCAKDLSYQKNIYIFFFSYSLFIIFSYCQRVIWQPEMYRCYIHFTLEGFFNMYSSRHFGVIVKF